MSEAPDTAFAAFQRGIQSLRATLGKSQAQTVGARAAKDSAKGLVQTWFRAIRAQLIDEGIDPALLLDVDTEMQGLLQLANGTNRRSTYVRVLRNVETHVQALEVQREIQLGQRQQAPGTTFNLSRTEQRIIETLTELIPSAAMSYQQALADMADQDRISYRGTANELRSAVWDVLDRLAPDEDVMAGTGFKLEKNRDKPTQKQKARFILRSRLGDTARRTPETTVDLIEERVGALTRAVYDRTSISTHVATAAAEIRQVKMYVDTLLAELLEIHQV